MRLLKCSNLNINCMWWTNWAFLRVSLLDNLEMMGVMGNVLAAQSGRQMIRITVAHHILEKVYAVGSVRIGFLPLVPLNVLFYTAIVRRWTKCLI